MKLSLDCLEPRDVPATLFVTGGDGPDTILILDRGAAGVEVVAAGKTTLHREIDRVVLDSGRGADQITVRFSADTTRSRDYDIRLGRGDDQFNLDMTGSASAQNPPTVPSRLSVVVNGGLGDDHHFIQVGGSQLPNVQPLRVDTEFFLGVVDPSGDVKNLDSAPGGNDSVWIDIDAVVFVQAAELAIELGGGRDTATYLVNEVEAASLGFTYAGGNGADDVTVAARKVSGNFAVRVDGGRGDDNVSVEVEVLPVPGPGPGPTIRGLDLVLLGGDGDDTIRSRAVIAGGVEPTPFRVNVVADGGDGDDLIDIRGSYRGGQLPPTGEVAVTVRGGRGDDLLAVLWPTSPSVRFAALADGGLGFDLAVLTPGVAARNCERVIVLPPPDPD